MFLDRNVKDEYMCIHFLCSATELLALLSHMQEKRDFILVKLCCSACYYLGSKQTQCIKCMYKHPKAIILSFQIHFYIHKSYR